LLHRLASLVPWKGNRGSGRGFCVGLATAAGLRSADRPLPPSLSFLHLGPVLRGNRDVLYSSLTRGRGRLGPGDPCGGFGCRSGPCSRSKRGSRVRRHVRLSVVSRRWSQARSREALLPFAGFCSPTGSLLPLPISVLPSSRFPLFRHPLLIKEGSSLFVIGGVGVFCCPSTLNPGRREGTGGRGRGFC